MDILNKKKGKSTSFIKAYFLRKKNKTAKLASLNFVEKYSTKHFKNLLDEKNSILISPNDIKYNSFINFGTPLQTFKNFYGKPEYSYHSPDNSDIYTLVYRTKIKGVKAKSALIFHRNKLVLFNYVFSKITKNEHEIIMDYSCKKFGNKIDNQSYKITDKDNNHLNIQNLNNEIVFNFFSGLAQQKFVFEKKQHKPDFVLNPDTLKAKASC